MEAKEITAIIAKEWKEMDTDGRAEYTKRVEEVKEEIEAKQQELAQEQEEKEKKKEKKKERKLSAYNVYVREQSKLVREKNPGMLTNHLMIIIIIMISTMIYSHTHF